MALIQTLAAKVKWSIITKKGYLNTLFFIAFCCLVHIARVDCFSSSIIEIRRTTAHLSQPSISGDYIIFMESDKSRQRFMLYSISTRTTKEIPLNPSYRCQTAPRIYGSEITYYRMRKFDDAYDPRGVAGIIRGFELYLQNINSYLGRNIGYSNVLVTDDNAPSISAEAVVWCDYHHPKYQLHLCLSNQPSAKERSLILRPWYIGAASVDGDIIVWEDSRNAGDNSYLECDIYGYSIRNNREFPICTAAGRQFQPDIHGCYVSWTDESGEVSRVFAKNLNTKETFIVSAGNEASRAPKVGTHHIALVSGKNGREQVMVYYLKHRALRTLSRSDLSNTSTSIDGNNLVWFSTIRDTAEINLISLGK